MSDFRIFNTNRTTLLLEHFAQEYPEATAPNRTQKGPIPRRCRVSSRLFKANPEQSKHLETARMKIKGVWIDLVNLRTEVYR